MQDIICGTATVGDRGQIVIPVDVRRKFNIHAGDKIWVFGHPAADGLVLLKSNSLQDLLSSFLTNLRSDKPDDPAPEADQTE